MVHVIQRLVGIVPQARRDIHERLTALLQHSDAQAVRRGIHALLQGTIGDQTKYRVGTWEHTAWQVLQGAETVVAGVETIKEATATLEPGQVMTKETPEPLDTM